MGRVLLALLTILMLLSIAVAHANEEITVELPGGATMEMVWIEPGTFVMGSTVAELSEFTQPSVPGRFDDEEPKHEVTITEGFYLGKYELTQEQWSSVMATQPWSGQSTWFEVKDDPQHPAVYISWDDVQGLIQQLNEAEGGSVYRLPTEAEWEFAARAGTSTAWSFGDDDAPETVRQYAWYDTNTCSAGECYTHAVGAKLPNPWGLHDMHGNVYEWVQDWYDAQYYSQSPQEDPPGPATGAQRVFRSGVFFDIEEFARSAIRYFAEPDLRADALGVRLLRMGPKVTAVAPQTWGRVKSALPSE